MSTDSNRPGHAELTANTGDLSLDVFRKHGHEMIEWIAEYLEDPTRYPVLSQSRPGDTIAALPRSAPATGEDMTAILADFERIIMPGITHWNNPSFFAYFAISSSVPGILGELLAAALDTNAMLWKSSPSATELEVVVLDWLRKALGLSTPWFGVINDTASISTMLALVAAREAAQPDIREKASLDAMMSPYCAFTVPNRHTHPWTRELSRLGDHGASSVLAGLLSVCTPGAR
jgi:aromatic-L-amino-acid/L-tryptophan decarboxylase